MHIASIDLVTSKPPAALDGRAAAHNVGLFIPRDLLLQLLSFLFFVMEFVWSETYFFLTIDDVG